MELIFSLEEIDTIASQILATNPKKVVLFNGEMGVGKTTLIKSLAKNLGVNDVTSSPTFSLVNEYQIIDNQYIYHFDVYRLKNEMEAMDMGIEDYLYSGNWCFIEWPEKIPNCIPDQHATITIELLPDGKRRLTLE
jgi:tRNA threonylcarbamoyladenosine biosynthesis protein TsaE